MLSKSKFQISFLLPHCPFIVRIESLTVATCRAPDLRQAPPYYLPNQLAQLQHDAALHLFDEWR